MGKFIWWIFFCILLILLSVCHKTGVGPDHPLYGLVINEFMAINNSIISDENGEYDDWIELFNGTGEVVDIGGMYISDDVNNKQKWQIPKTNPTLTTISAGGFLLIWADRETAQGILHVGFKLSGSGEAVVITDSDGKTVVDSYEFGPQTTDVSMGRQTNGADKWIKFDNPTPGAGNY